MEFADAAIDPPLEALLDVGAYAGIVVPVSHVVARPVRPQERDDGLRRSLVELQRAVVGRAGDDRPAHALRAQNRERAVSRVHVPIGAAVVNVSVEDRELGGGWGRRAQGEEQTRQQDASPRRDPSTWTPPFTPHAADGTRDRGDIRRWPRRPPRRRR